MLNMFPPTGEPRAENKSREIKPDELLPPLRYVVEYGTGPGAKFVLATADKALAAKFAELLNFYQRPVG